MPDSKAGLRILASFRGADADDWPGEIAALSAAGIDGLHLDVMDGVFAAPPCFAPADVERLRSAGARFLDVHLLVDSPERAAPDWLATQVDRLSFHVERVEDPGALCARIREAGCTPGLALLPPTPVQRVRPWLQAIGLVNPLGVNPTAEGGFDESTFARIAELVRMREEAGLDFVIQGDGGVWAKTRDAFVEAGADELVGGYPIFSSDDYGQAVRALRDG